MPDYLSILVAACAAVALAVPAGSAVSVVPKPKSIEFPAQPAVPLDVGGAVIVVGDRAGEPEKYAAETLRDTVRKRWHLDWPIIREGDAQAAAKLSIYLGTRQSSSRLDGLCRDWSVDLSEDSPGHDGYVIRMGESGGHHAVIVGGSNARGVIYGQDTLFQLITSLEGKPALQWASVRDWPSIPWRGRPQSRNELHLRPGTMDSYMRARMNYIDLRDSILPRRGQYGYIPGLPINREEVAKVLAEAHRRGMFVYANVLCAVPSEQFDAAERTCEELLSLGADGIWISIDDPGAPGRWGMPHELMARIVDLGRKHGITGRKIAVIPGRYNSKNVASDDNLKAFKIPGMDESLYFFTMTPSIKALEDARRLLGLKTRPGWWHNWPRPAAGFTFNAYGGTTTRKGDKPAYLELPQLTLGWNAPTYEELARAGECLDAVQPFGGGGWGADYTNDVIGWWAWAPELHDWESTRRRIYDVVYGPGQVDTAIALDERLPKLKDLFLLKPAESGREDFDWPPRLRNQEDRGKAHELAAEIRKLIDTLRQRAPQETLLDAYVLETWYLEPAEAQVKAADRMADLPYPEYWWEAHVSRMLSAVHSGNFEQAQTWQREARDRALKETQQVVSTLNDLQGIDDYERTWAARFGVTEIRRAGKAPQLRGNLSDPLWQNAAKITDMMNSARGDKPKNATVVYVTYTDDALYVGFECIESDMDKLTCSAKGRDGDVWKDDSVELFLNPNSLGKPYWQFATNVDGTVMDGCHVPGQEFDGSWNGEWEVRTARGEDRWTAEFRIPFKALELDGSPQGQIWLANFARNDYAGAEQDCIPNIPVHVSAWGPGADLHDPAKFRPLWLK